MADMSLPSEEGKKLEDIRKEAEERSCPVQRALYFIGEFIDGPMCSRCFPCSFGTAEAKIRLIRLSDHPETASAEDIQALRRISVNMTEASFCKKGKDTGRFILETLDAFEEDIGKHLSGECTTRECISLIQYFIKPELCIMCGKCLEACEYDAVIGERIKPYMSGYLPFEIRQTKCTRCGECIKVCPTGAIEIIAVPREEIMNVTR